MFAFFSAWILVMEAVARFFSNLTEEEILPFFIAPLWTSNRSVEILCSFKFSKLMLEKLEFQLNENWQFLKHACSYNSLICKISCSLFHLFQIWNTVVSLRMNTIRFSQPFGLWCVRSTRNRVWSSYTCTSRHYLLQVTIMHLVLEIQIRHFKAAGGLRGIIKQND